MRKELVIEIVLGIIIVSVAAMYYSKEYAKYVCRYLCDSGDSIHCIYDDENIFLSMTFLNPILLFEDLTEEKMKKELELYVGKKNDYEFQKIAMDDKVCYGYVKKVSGIETAEGVRVIVDSMGKVNEISKYKLDEEIESINQEEVSSYLATDKG